MRKVAYITSAVLAVAIVFAGVSFAVNADSTKGPAEFKAGGKIIDRAAQILNIDSQKLADALKQAGTEARQQGIADRFDKLVADGKLTQEQVSQIKTWMAAKPAGPCLGQKAMDKLLADGKITQAQYDSWKSWWDSRPKIDLPVPQKPTSPQIKGPQGQAPDITTMLDKWVSEGKLTQEQADQWKAWWSSKPNTPLPLPQRPDGGAFHRGLNKVN